MNRLLAAGALTGAMVFALPVSADSGNGVLNFSGSVVNAPCNLNMEQANQSVDLGSHMSDRIEVPFSITFTNCTATPAQISWSGDTYSDYQIRTSTTGLLVMITRTDGGVNDSQNLSGSKNTLPNFVDGDNTVNFMVITANEVDWASVAEGPYTASANFTMHYE